MYFNIGEVPEAFPRGKITKASIIAKMSRWVPSRSFSGPVC